MNIGHNSQNVSIQVEVRLFNSITKFQDMRGTRFSLDLQAGKTVGELIEELHIPHKELFLVLVNGRDITSGLVGAPVRGARVLEEGDVVALSGAVPYSYGYGAPVV